MTNLFKPALKKTLTYEGGWSDNPKDPGGATMHGITLTTYRLFKANATKHDLLIIPPAMVEHIYRTNYWDNIVGDKLPPGVGAVTFDYAVNSGLGRALRALRAAQAAYPHDPAAQVAHICDSRLAFLKSLKTFPVFGKGWTRRVSGVKAFGLSLTSPLKTAAPLRSTKV
jgi:lysozyme family protein